MSHEEWFLQRNSENQLEVRPRQTWQKEPAPCPRHLVTFTERMSRGGHGFEQMSRDGGKGSREHEHRGPTVAFTWPQVPSQSRGQAPRARPEPPGAQVPPSPPLRSWLLLVPRPLSPEILRTVPT